MSNQGDLQLIVYVSAASQPFADKALEELLTKARQNNSARGITGLLLYIEGSIIQALEGPKEEVIPLFHTIENDPRHQMVLPLINEPITQREFPDWTMGYRQATKSEIEALEGYTPLLDSEQHSREELLQDAGKAKKLLANFKSNFCR